MDVSGLTLAGLGIGVLVGLTGVGGGSLMTPLLVTAFGVPIATAIGTDLACAAVTKSAGTVAHRRQATVVPRVTWLLMSGSMPAALAVLAWLALARLDTESFQQILRYAMAGAILLSIGALALQMTLRRRAAHAVFTRANEGWRAAATILAGALIGGLVALTSLGAGAIGAALLTLLHPRLEPAEIAGTDIAQAVPLTVVAACGHAWLGHVDSWLLLALLAGTVPGILVGSRMVRIVPAWTLRTLLMATLGLAVVKLVA